MRKQFASILCASLFALPALSGVTRIERSAGSPFELSLDVNTANPVVFSQTGYAEYANEGEKDIAAPYVRIEASNGTQLRFTPSDEWSESLEFLAVSEEFPASRLRPGEKGRIAFEYRSFGKSVDIEFGYTRGNENPFPWKANAPRMRPSWADDVVWGLCFSTLRSNIGTTWNDYLSRMRSDADHLSNLGEKAYRLDDLWQLEVNEALGADFAIPSLDESTDLMRPARGFGLAFTRTYGTALSLRLRKGILGHGWSDNYSAWAELTDNGRTLAFHGGNGGTYLFRKMGGKWVPESGRDKSTLWESEEGYVLVSDDGLQMCVGKDVMRTTLIRDRQGNELRFSYDGDGRLVRVAHNDGQFLEFAYRDGLLESVSDDLGRKATYEYDGDMLVGSTSFDGLKTKYRYLPVDNTVNSRALRQIVLPDGNTQDFTYDQRGRLATISVNGGMVTEIRRGRLGSFTTIAPNGAETRVKIGSKGMPLEAVNAIGQKLSFNYTEESLLSSVIGPTGRKSEIEYDAEGRPVAAKDPLGATMRFGYREGRVDSVTDARGNSYKFGYDEMGRGNSVAFAGGPASKVEYSERGDVARYVNARGQSISMTYDNVGRPLTKTWDTGRKFSWTYDGRGNCVRAEDSETGAVTMEYDSLDRLVKIVHPGDRGFAYEYDSLGRIVKKTSIDDGSEQRYAFDKLGRLAKVTDGKGALVLENEYDENTGRIARQRNGNGTSTTYAYDILGRATRIEHLGPGGKSIGFFAYEYDENGNRVSQTTAEGVERYEYDAANQLIGVTYPDGTKETFSYDAVGNRLSANGVTYETNERNQIIRTVSPDGAETRYEYDGDGNLVRREEAGGAVTEYAYDIENRLVSVKSAVKGIEWACEYDVLGNRVKVTDHGKTTERLYSNEGIPSVAAEYENGVTTARHVLLAGLVLADMDADGAVRWRHADTISSTRIVTDGAGKVTGTASYKAFGEVRATDGDAPVSGWLGGLGVENDPTGLLFMRNRNYDPGLGRFIQQDPIGLVGGQINLYVYCGNSPVMGVDFLGLYNLCYFWRDLNKWSNVIGAVAGGIGLVVAVVGMITTAPAWLTAIATGAVVAGAIASVTALISDLVNMLHYEHNFVWSRFIGDVVGVILSGIGGVLNYSGRATYGGIRSVWSFLTRGGELSRDTVKAIRQLLNLKQYETIRNCINVAVNAIEAILSGAGAYRGFTQTAE